VRITVDIQHGVARRARGNKVAGMTLRTKGQHSGAFAHALCQRLCIYANLGSCCYDFLNPNVICTSEMVMLRCALSRYIAASR